MTKINFTSTQQPDSTHRISDGMESSYFSWAVGVNSDEIIAAYASGYDINDGDEAFEATMYDIDDNSVTCKATIEFCPSRKEHAMTRATHNNHFKQITGQRAWDSAPLPASADLRAVHVAHRRLSSPLGPSHPSRLISVAAYLQTKDGRSRYCPTISAEAWSALLGAAPDYQFSEAPDPAPEWVSRAA
jgi:hypothetical protein